MVSQHFSLQLFLSLFTIEFFQKDFYDTPFTPSPPFAERHLWKISRYSFDRKLKAVRGTEGADLGFVFLKKKKKVLGGGEGREGTQKGQILTCPQPQDDPSSFCV